MIRCEIYPGQNYYCWDFDKMAECVLRWAQQGVTVKVFVDLEH